MKYSNGTITQCYIICVSLSDLVSCAFSTIPICPFLIQRIFHSLVYIGLAHYYGIAIIVWAIAIILYFAIYL